MLREMLKLANDDAVVCHLLFIVECSNESLSRAYITLSDNLKCSYNPLEYLLSGPDEHTTFILERHY